MHNKSDACDDESNETEAEVNRTLFLRGFDDKTTEDELYELFLQVSLQLLVFTEKKINPKTLGPRGTIYPQPIIFMGMKIEFYQA
mgnify:CR=1 FL=1